MPANTTTLAELIVQLYRGPWVEALFTNTFLLAAQSKGIVDPDVAFLIARALPGFTAVQVDDEGKVTGIDEVVETLVKEKPYLVSQPQQQPKPQSVGAASNPAQQSPPPPKNLAEAGDRLEQALRTGVT